MATVKIRKVDNCHDCPFAKKGEVYHDGATGTPHYTNVSWFCWIDGNMIFDMEKSSVVGNTIDGEGDGDCVEERDGDCVVMSCPLPATVERRP